MFLGNLKLGLVLLLILPLFYSCRQGINFDPDFHVADHLTQSIISERGDVIPCSDPRFDQYAAMHQEKIKELKKLLMSHKIGASNRGRVAKEYQHLTERMSQPLSRNEKFQAINEYFQYDDTDVDRE